MSDGIKHIAIIMDGNGRWAERRFLPRSAGHKKGAEKVKEIAKAVNGLGIKFLTLYAFSTENWQRPKEEVDALMALLRQYLNSDFKELHENNIRIRFIGERYMLDDDIRRDMAALEAQTAENSGMTLCFAISYGSRQEIVNAVREIAVGLKNGDISESDIDIAYFSDMLYTKGVPDPDILIRTGGEQRISNYLLWQIAYAELFFSPAFWPDFDSKELEAIIKDFNSRERRYGKV